MEPALYATMQYTLIEISSVLATTQVQRLKAHASKVAVRRQDILTWSASQPEPIQDKCFMIALEVLDNLPHDKVIMKDGTLMETWIEECPVHGHRETYQPVQDSALLSALEHFPVSLPHGMSDHR